MKKLTLEWIKKAEGDYLVAKREFKSAPPVYEAVCFHAQQCLRPKNRDWIMEFDEKPLHIFNKKAAYILLRVCAHLFG